MGKTCPQCGNEYKKLGSHLTASSCDYPKFTKQQTQILEGLMLGDGWINHQTKRENAKPFFAVGMTNYKFLKWFNEQMQPHTTGVKNATGSKGSTKPYYKVRTMRSPELERFEDWYSNGEIKLGRVNLSPTTLKMWYVSDGSLGHCGKAIYIANASIDNRDEYFNGLFSNLDVEPIVEKKSIRFSTGNSKTLFEYMGNPPPGFEYKWDYDYSTDRLWDELALELRNEFENNDESISEFASEKGLSYEQVHYTMNDREHKAKEDPNQTEIYGER